MKDLIVIDNSLSYKFWAKVMETANYLKNKLPTKIISHGKVISEELWTGQKQNLQHICIFGSLALCNISEEKRSKSDHQKFWEKILIGYNPDMTKYFQIWALQTR